MLTRLRARTLLRMNLIMKQRVNLIIIQEIMRLSQIIIQEAQAAHLLSLTDQQGELFNISVMLLLADYIINIDVDN